MKKAKRSTKEEFLATPGVTIVGRDQGDSADYVVCARSGSNEYFRDDIRTVCAVCAGGIHYRPHAPKAPPKICLDCALVLAQHGPEAAN